MNTSNFQRQFSPEPAWPTRRFFNLESTLEDDYKDHLGFLTSSGRDVTLGAEALVTCSAALIVAPPWFGKTHFAMSLDGALRSGVAPKEVCCADYVHFTSFHRFGSGCEIKPRWWSKWLNDAERACWIVDAIDEDWHRDRAVFAVLDEVERIISLSPHRLSLIMFCRQLEIPDELISRLHELYDRSDEAGLRKFVLAPPDVDAAIAIAGSAVEFESVLKIANSNHLGEIASYPDVIQLLARHPTNEPVSRRDVWKKLLDNILRGGARERRDGIDSTLTDRFDAAKRIAAVMTFSALHEVDDSSMESSAPSVETFFSLHTNRETELRKAARDLTHTTLLAPTRFGRRFAHQRVQEWFTAFAVERLQINRLRPLVCIDGVVCPRFEGLFGILRDVLPDGEAKVSSIS